MTYVCYTQNNFIIVLKLIFIEIPLVPPITKNAESPTNKTNPKNMISFFDSVSKTVSAILCLFVYILASKTTNIE